MTAKNVKQNECVVTKQEESFNLHVSQWLPHIYDDTVDINVKKRKKILIKYC